ncbi:MAG: DUF3592 domain-containing protein [Burkholderiales bacterium]
MAGGMYGYGRIDPGLEYAREATGIVADLVYESGTKKGRIHPVVRYRTADGREILGQSQKHRNLRPGERVQIVYDIRNPQEIEIGTLAEARHRRGVIAGVTIAIGIASILAGAVMHFGLFRSRL